MAEVAHSDTSSPDTDKDFDPSADMMVHDYDDERTLDEEEAMTSGESCTGELDDLHKESEMPIEDLLARYAFGTTAVEDMVDNSQCTSSSSSEDETLESHIHNSVREVVTQNILNTRAEERVANVGELAQSVPRSQTERLLRSTRHPESDDSESSSEGENYEPIEEHKKTIQVGSDFQAVIPVGLCTYGDAPAYENEDRLLWDPSKIKDESALNDYLCNVQREVDRKLHTVSNIPRGRHIRDDEQALFLLLQCDNNIEEAERRRKMQAVPPTDVMSLWSEDECRNFEDGLRLYGKNFHEIHLNKVRTRSVYELVHFYYLWKKTERHDIFAAKTRAEKRKYSLNPGVIDHMDRFLEEQEVELHQLMTPQSSETKTETNEDEHTRPTLGIFSTGKGTIVSPSRHFDKSLTKGDHHGSSKHLHHHHHGEVNGSSSTDLTPEHSSPKKLKIDITSSDHPSPKRQKLNEHSQEPSQKQENSNTSPLSLSSIPPSTSCDKSPSRPECASEQGNMPKHIVSSAAASLAAGGALNPDTCNLSKTEGSNTVDKVLGSETSALATNSSGKLGSVTAVVGSKSLGVSGESHPSDITNCIRKPITAESGAQ